MDTPAARLENACSSYLMVDGSPEDFPLVRLYKNGMGYWHDHLTWKGPRSTGITSIVRWSSQVTGRNPP